MPRQENTEEKILKIREKAGERASRVVVVL